MLTNAVAVLDGWLKIKPNDVNTLIAKGYLRIQVGDYTNAVPPLDRALSVQPDNLQALLNRAIAHWRARNLELAKADYMQALKLHPEANLAWFGLGEIAFQHQDTNTATRCYLAYLSHSNSVPGSPEAGYVRSRLKELGFRSR